MKVPEPLRYSEDHMWVTEEVHGRNVLVRAGLTDYGQDLLGEVEFVELPTVGARLGEADVLAEVEARKATSELYAPLAGRVVAVNEALADAPEVLNSDPCGAGWLALLDPDDLSSAQRLMDGPAYERYIGG